MAKKNWKLLISLSILYIWSIKPLFGMQTIDSVLIEKLKNGDVSAYEIIFRSHYNEIYRYTIGLIGNSDEAEDLIQELFVWLWENKHLIRLDKSLKAYLLKILHNKALNHIKHKNVKQKYKDEKVKILEEEQRLQQDYLEYYKENPSPENIEQKIKNAIEKLPEQCRRIFKLNRLEGLKYREISEKMGLSLSTVKNQMSIALKKIRENL